MRARLRAGPVLRTALAILVAALIIKFLAAADPTATKVQGPDTAGNQISALLGAAGAPGSLATTVTASNDAPAAAASASMPAVAGKTNYCTGVFFSNGGATATTVITYTLSGIQGGSLTFNFKIGTNVNTPTTQQIIFPVPLAASAPNTAITFADTSPGAGNAVNSVVITGYVQ